MQVQAPTSRNEMQKRAQALMSTGNTKESAAVKIGAEFHAAAYVSRGSLFASYKDDEGKPKVAILA